MVVYFDTSAFMPLLLSDEAGAESKRIWRAADQVVATRLLYVEAASALGRARSQQRMIGRDVELAIERLQFLWDEFRVVEFDADLAERAADLSWRFGLRGFDATHCAAGHILHERSQSQSDGEAETTLVAASGDRQLLSAWRELGVATFEPGPA